MAAGDAALLRIRGGVLCAENPFAAKVFTHLTGMDTEIQW